MRTCRGPWAPAEPDLIADNDVGEAISNLLEVFVEVLESALALDFSPGIGKHGAVAGNDLDLVSELPREFLQAPFRYIGPNAQHVGVIGDFYP
jgi:hypothetical protein